MQSLENKFYFGTLSSFDCVLTLKQYVLPILGSGVNIELFSHDLDINVNVHQVSNPLQHELISHFIMNKWIWIPIPLAWWCITHLYEDVMGNGCKCASIDSYQIPTIHAGTSWSWQLWGVRKRLLTFYKISLIL